MKSLKIALIASLVIICSLGCYTYTLLGRIDKQSQTMRAMRSDMLLLEMSNSSYREYIESRKESGNIFEIIELERIE